MKMFRILICNLFFTVCLSAQWTQIGSDIDGIFEGGRFGSSISLSADGTRVVVSALNSNINVGVVNIFELIDSDWKQIGQDLIGQDDNGSFGTKISISGDGSRIAVLTPGYSYENCSFCGSVSIYDNIENVWTLVGQEILSNNDQIMYGNSLSLSGNGQKIAFGVSNFTDDLINSVRVYEFLAGQWLQIGQDISGNNQGDGTDGFGNQLSLSSDGEIIIVGIFLYNGSGQHSGQVKVYQEIDNLWIQLGAEINGDAAEDHFGRAVSISDDGNRIAVAANLNDYFAENSGLVRVFDFIDNAWIQAGQDIYGTAINDVLGTSISLSSNGEYLAIGISGSDDVGEHSGKAGIYTIDENWTLVDTFIQAEAAGDRAGSDISISSNGKIFALSAHSNDGAGEDAGHVRVFEYSPITGITNVQNNLVCFYPNPTSGAIYLKSNVLQGEIYYLIDSFGRLISKSIIKNNSLDLSQYPEGIYYLCKTVHGKSIIISRIVKI